MSPRFDMPCLEHRPDPEAGPVRISIDRSPFRIGRSDSADLICASPRISKHHAELREGSHGWVVEDLGSRNGTFVNGDRLEGERRLKHGDVLHVAHRELRFVFAKPTTLVDDDDATLGGTGSEAEERKLRSTRDLYRILTGRRVSAVFQPIYTLADRELIGYEALGRHTLTAVDYDVTSLFRIASERSRAEELARMMREAACRDASWLPEPTRVFMNVHPDEMARPDLVEELLRAAEAIGDRVLVVEVHEGAITEPGAMRELKAALGAEGVELAYDDFGAGRSRLMELAEVPPDYLKLDMSLVRGIDGSRARQDLVAALVRVMRDAGVQVVAEGIETDAEHETCAALGCGLGQGFLYRRPQTVRDLRETWP